MDQRTVLARHPVYAALPPEVIAQLAARGVFRRYRRGDSIWKKGDPAREFYVVVQGLVALFVPCGAGRSIMVGLFEPGQSVGDVQALEGTAYTSAAFAFTTPQTVLALDRAEVLAALAMHGAAALALGRGLGRVNEQLTRRLALSTTTADARLARILLDLGERFGDELEDGSVLIPLRVTRAQLASLVGATVETTIRTLSRWHRDGHIVSDELGIVIKHPAQLASLAGNEETAGPEAAPPPGFEV